MKTILLAIIFAVALQAQRINVLGPPFDYIGTGSSSAPPGSSGGVIFNSAGVFGADTGNLFWDSVNKRLGIGTANPATKLHVFDTTATTGSTTLTVQAGAGQSSTDLQQWKDSAGTVLAFMGSNGFASMVGLRRSSTASNGWQIGYYAPGFGVGPAALFSWGSTDETSVDTALARNAAGVVEVNNGTAGAYRDIRFRKGQLGTTTVSGLGTCNSGAEGTAWAVTDGLTVTGGATLAPGSILTGGGTSHSGAYCNGTNWVAL